ncbi:MAG TPA: type II secretion system secretin GspD [Oligoflexus sp.]|uniref:type II secretion system secretin GspD n=1 Tax=Oligoflexus sp. TaxID=1971216 RepID=UPI002D7EB9EC|nr:type II secretion system secretin GspD [Oligoflexus sp.]HET9238579.1 type II secretion system secretin GspD [Oligoflexus sp.]
MIRLRQLTTAVILSLGAGKALMAQDDNPPPMPEESMPDEPEGPSDSPRLPSGPAFGQPGAKTPGAENVPEGQELVSIDFPEPTEIKDIIRAVALWTGKNVIIGKGVSGKVQMISPKKVTKDEAYQAFLSALNVLGYTTVETGKVIKILPTRNALKGNLHIYQGTTWAPRTDKLITQIVPLKYIDAKQIQQTLSQLVSTNSMIAYQPTNTLIISDTGYKVRRILQIVELLDVAGQQPKVALVPIRYGDAKAISQKVQEILQVSETSKRGGQAGGATFKVSVDERSNSVVIFGPPRTIQDVKDLVKKFDFPVEDPANQAAIRVRFLDYADAKKVATTLSSLAQGSATGSRRTPISSPVRTIGQNNSGRMNTPSGPAPVAELGDNVKITADESSNSLLITGSRAAYDAINSIVRKLDRRRPQVYVEADILDVNLSDDFSFGTSILLGSKSGKSIQSYGWQGQGVTPIVAASSITNAGGANAALDTTTKAGVASALSKDFTIGVLAGQPIEIPGIGSVTPAGLITMLKSDGNTRVLSSPHLLTSNNEVAKIVVGDKIFYKTATQSAAIGVGAIEKVEKEDADLSLELKPNISHTGNYVTLKLDLEASEGGLNPNTNLPNINKRQTSQLVTVKNGQTAVISGLVKRREAEIYQKIPLLGDIPILGWLFRNSTLKKETTSLMIFLTPHIVYGANDLAAIYDKKVQERDDLMAKAFGSDEDDEFIKALPARDAGRYHPDANDAREEREQELLRRQQQEDRGELEEKPAGKPELGERPEDPTTVPMPTGGFDETPMMGGPGGGMDGGNDVPPPPPPPPPPVPVPTPEPMDMPEPMEPPQ